MDSWALFLLALSESSFFSDKVFTISAGAFEINFTVFVITSAISRAARFFLVAWLIYIFGPKIKTFIDKYFNILAITFVVLLAAGFVIIKIIF